MVRNSLQIRGDVGGEEDRPPLLDEEVAEDVEDLQTRDGVQARGGLVENEEFGAVGERQGELKLDALAPRQVLDPDSGRHVQSAQKILEEDLVPVGVEAPQVAGGRGGRPLRGQGHGIHDDADTVVAGTGCGAEDPDRAGLDVDHAEHGLDGGGLARAVGSDEAGDQTARNGHVEGAEGEGPLFAHDGVEADRGPGRRTGVGARRRRVAHFLFVAVHR